MSLTKRETEVIELLSKGLSNKRIAEGLTLSTRTIETHVNNMLIKTNCENRTQLAYWWNTSWFIQNNRVLPFL